jgi:hypothetical protein
MYYPNIEIDDQTSTIIGITITSIPIIYGIILILYTLFGRKEKHTKILVITDNN